MAVGGSDALAALSMDMALAALPEASPLLSAFAVLPAACNSFTYTSAKTCFSTSSTMECAVRKTHEMAVQKTMDGLKIICITLEPLGSSCLAIRYPLFTSAGEDSLALGTIMRETCLKEALWYAPENCTVGVFDLLHSNLVARSCAMCCQSIRVASMKP